MGSKLFNDAVHGHIEFHPLIVSIIDTPQFQRLRNIKQTGPCYFVYPGATHTRFEHSLGTSFLAGRLMEALNQKGNFDEQRRKETLCVQIAGLCHDLGHGPFSHTWEKFMKRCGIDFEHEKMSVEIFDQILKETVPNKEKPGEKISVIELFKINKMDNYIDKIKSIILGKRSKDSNELYLYQIINNKENGVDVDKWDYLMRDSKMVNVPINFDCYRMIHCCQVLETKPGRQEICFRDKECAMLINMFLSRGLLHDVVYQHRKVKIIEEMLLDAFVLAKDRLKLTSTHVDDFLKLTDHIFQKILFDDFENDGEMSEAKKILEKLLKRNLYVCIAAKEVEGKYKPETLRRIEDEIFKELKQDDCALQRSLICCSIIDVQMTKYNKDKLLSGVMVYHKQGHPEERSGPRDFETDKYQGLKPELKNLKHVEILVLYKGDDRLKYYTRRYDSLLSKILTKLLTC